VSITLFHRTTIAQAREVAKNGFLDRKWDLGVLDTGSGEAVSVTGIWLSGRPLSNKEGVDGDAQLEVVLNISEEDLEPFELEGLLWDTRFWVAPAEFLNRHASVRIFEVDPRTSWFDNVWEEENES
jgi:hypothetical protein